MLERDEQTLNPTLYRVFLEPSMPHGGKHIAVFAEGVPEGEMQTLAHSSGAPLSVFIGDHKPDTLELRCFTPKAEKGESDSGALAALHHLHARGSLGGAVTVRMPRDTLKVRFLEGMWWLEQGSLSVDLHRPTSLYYGLPESLYVGLGLNKSGLYHVVNSSIPFGVVRTKRPKLVMPLSRLRSLEELEPDYTALGQFVKPYGAAGVVALALEGWRMALRYYMVGERKEDSAGANTAACAAAYLTAYDNSRGFHSSVHLRSHFEVEQGVWLGAPSRIYVERREGRFWSGGHVQAVG